MSSFIDKIKSYNQILLSIAGTIGVLFLCGFSIMVVIDECNFNRTTSYQAGIISTPNTDSLVSDSLRQQLITFERIELIDSINKVYLLPIGQSNLKKQEATKQLLGLANGFGKYEEDYSYYDTDLNNLVVYESEIDSSYIVFNNRVSIRDYEIYKKDSNNYIIIIAARNDSNDDGYLNYEDLQVPYIYDVSSRNIFEVKMKEKFTVLNTLIPTTTNDVIFVIGLDRNLDGIYDYGEGPQFFYRLNVEEKVLKELVNVNQVNKLQHLLEGSLK